MKTFLEDLSMFLIHRWLRKGRYTTFTLLALFLIVGHVAAQATCSSLVDAALDSLDTQCAGLERNQACYGNVSLEATPQDDVSGFTFDKVGDIVDVTEIQSLKLEPMDEATGMWGVVMMQLQADIPDSLPGQNVTFILFGNVEIENASTEDQAPMQAFTLKTGVSDAGCEEAPESGVMIQTPEGVESVSFNVNGVDMEIGSTVMLQAEPEGDMTVATMEGAAVMEMEGQSYAVICGTELSIPMDAAMKPRGAPPMPIALRTSRMGDQMAFRALPQPLEKIEVITDAKMRLLEARLESGLAPCGVGDLPACVHALAPDDLRVWASEGSFGIPIPEILPLPTLALPGGDQGPGGGQLPGLPGGNSGPPRPGKP
jgi:hypothetical protein